MSKNKRKLDYGDHVMIENEEQADLFDFYWEENQPKMAYQYKPNCFSKPMFELYASRVAFHFTKGLGSAQEGYNQAEIDYKKSIAIQKNGELNPIVIEKARNNKKKVFNKETKRDEFLDDPIDLEKQNEIMFKFFARLRKRVEAFLVEYWEKFPEIAKKIESSIKILRDRTDLETKYRLEAIEKALAEKEGRVFDPKKILDLTPAEKVEVEKIFNERRKAIIEDYISVNMVFPVQIDKKISDGLILKMSNRVWRKVTPEEMKKEGWNKLDPDIQAIIDEEEKENNPECYTDKGVFIDKSERKNPMIKDYDLAKTAQRNITIPDKNGNFWKYNRPYAVKDDVRIGPFDELTSYGSNILAQISIDFCAKGEKGGASCFFSALENVYWQEREQHEIGNFKQNTTYGKSSFAAQAEKLKEEQVAAQKEAEAAAAKLKAEQEAAAKAKEEEDRKKYEENSLNHKFKRMAEANNNNNVVTANSSAVDDDTHSTESKRATNPNKKVKPNTNK